MKYPATDFSVCDARIGCTCVHSEDGALERADLNIDPWQLDNAIDDLFCAAARAALEARMRELAGVP